VRLVADPIVREHIDERGGAIYVWPRRYGCCRGRTHVLEAGTEAPDRDFELVHAADGFQVFAPPGLLEPEELHLELSRRGTLRAFWNGQAWIG
jgi:hypothetical protein